MALDWLERVRELLEYDPVAGTLHWRVRRGPILAGSRAGCVHKWNGYRYVLVEGRAYREHRIIWLMMTGKWPDCQIDHINGKRDDNRWVNLRSATDNQNKANTGVRAKSGLKGVVWSRGKWEAYITANKKVRNLGRFETKEAAHAAYCKAASEAFGEFARFA